jgi:hypothetical protein
VPKQKEAAADERRGGVEGSLWRKTASHQNFNGRARAPEECPVGCWLIFDNLI